MDLYSLIFLLATPLWIMLLQAIGVRIGLFSKTAPQKAMVVYCILVGIVSPFAVMLLEKTTLWERPQLLLLSFFLSMGLAHVYFHIFNMSETARRIRILVSLKAKGNRSLSDDSLSEDSPSEMIERRIDRLLQLEQVREENGNLRGRFTVLTFASILVRWHERLLFPERKQDISS